jgi:cytochrome c oxidase cbb3-type subunit III
MRAWSRIALPAALLVLVLSLHAQEPPARGGGGRGLSAAIAGAKEDPAVVDRGAKLYGVHCAGCHGATGRGGAGTPDLIRSLVVLGDEKGILISPILRNGRPDQGMPKPNLTEAEIADLVAWLHVQTYAAGHRTTYAFLDVVTGDPKKGEAYFNSTGTCSTCHSVTGDLRGIGSRFEPIALQQIWLQPRRAAGGRGGRGAAVPSRSAITATVTLPSGEKISGTLDRIDDFTVSLRDDAGTYRSFSRDGATPKVEVRDPLQAHRDLLSKYTDADIHNVTAFLVTLK